MAMRRTLCTTVRPSSLFLRPSWSWRTDDHFLFLVDVIILETMTSMINTQILPPYLLTGACWSQHPCLFFCRGTIAILLVRYPSDFQGHSNTSSTVEMSTKTPGGTGPSEKFMKKDAAGKSPLRPASVLEQCRSLITLI